MLITVARTFFTDRSTCGELYLDQPLTVPLFCYSLEPPKQPDDRGIKCIPQGTYKVIIAPSERFQRDMPRLLGVPGWPNDDVLIHYGNYPDDTEGCILVGLTHEPDFIGASRSAFDLLYQRILPAATAGDLTISVIG
jgi:hypothetical protein